MTLPLPLILIGISRNEFNFGNLRPAVVFSWLAFLVFTLISVIFSASQIFSIPAFFQILAIFLFFTLFLLTAREERLKISFGLVITVGLSLSLVSFYYLLPWVAKPAVGMNLIYASYGHNHLADVLLLSLPLALGLFLTTKSRRAVILLSLLILLYIVALVLTFSRGAFLVLPPMVLLMILLAKPKLVSQKFLSWLLILLPIGLICLIGVFSLSQTGLEAKLAQPQNWLVKQLVKPEFQAKRIEYWQQALEGFVAKPLTGFGWGTFELVTLRFQRTTAGWSNYTHNFYLQVLAEAGIFAFLGFLSFLGPVFYESWQLLKRNRGDPLILGGSAAILASSLHSFLDFDWHFPAVFLLFLLITANLLEKVGALRSPRNFLFGIEPLVKEIFSVRLAHDSSKKFVAPRAPLKFILLFLAIIVFLFGQLEVLSEYFEQKKDYQTALLLSPWSAVRARQLGDKLFAVDFKEGEKAAKRLIEISRKDPSMNSWLAEKYKQAGRRDLASFYFRQAIIFNPLGNFYLYPKLGKIYDHWGQLEKSAALYQFFNQNLARMRIETGNNQLAKTFYQIGLNLLNTQKEKEALLWWQKAAAWGPEWSFFHIEAASLALKTGDRGLTENIIDKCLTYDSPRAHCQNYAGRLVTGKKFETPGFWQGEIQKIPDH